MTTRNPHETWAMVEETALGTSTLANAEQFRFNETVTAPEQIGQLQDNPNMGHENVNDRRDKGLHFYQRMDDAISFTSMLRTNAAGKINPLTTWLKSGGLSVATQASATTLAGTPAVGSLELTADVGAIGQAALVELDNGLLYPVLAADYSASTITPSMDLSSATSATNNVTPMDTTIAPGNVDVPATQTLSFVRNTRMEYAAASGLEDTAWDYTGCALNTWSMEFTPGGDVQIPLSFHACKAAQRQDALAASTFRDTGKYIKLDDNCEFTIDDASAAGGITSSTLNFKSITFTPGTSTVGEDATGGGSYVDTSRFISSIDKTTVVITAKWDRSFYDDFTGTNTSKYIHLIQPSSSTAVPAFGLWLPNCYLQEDGTQTSKDENFVDVQLTYVVTAAGYGSDTTNGSRGMGTFYFATSNA